MMTARTRAVPAMRVELRRQRRQHRLGQRCCAPAGRLSDQQSRCRPRPRAAAARGRIGAVRSGLERSSTSREAFVADAHCIRSDSRRGEGERQPGTMSDASRRSLSAKSLKRCSRRNSRRRFNAAERAFDRRGLAWRLPGARQASSSNSSRPGGTISGPDDDGAGRFRHVRRGSPRSAGCRWR